MEVCLCVCIHIKTKQKEKKHTMKRILSLVLCALMVIAIVPMTVFAEEAPVATFTLGADGSTGHVDGSSATTYSETVNGYTLSITGGTKMYTGGKDEKGNSALEKLFK